MSHFSLLVLSRGKDCISDLLEPFNENLVYPRYIKYTKEELKKKVRQDLHDYKASSTYQEWIKDKEAYKLKYSDNKDHLEYLEVTFPKLMKMSNERLYKREITRFYDADDIDSEGNVLSTYNPKSKWDWYSIGGRWDGLLRTKNGERVNEGAVGNLDFSPNEKEYNDAIRFWELKIENREPKNEDEKAIVNGLSYRPSYYVERYGTKENYAKIVSSFTTYAVLTPDGVWREPGEMGWFGCSFATTESEKEWDDNYYKFIELAKKKKYYMTVVDCHI